MSLKLKTLLPAVVLLSGGVGAWALVAHRPEVANQAPASEPPLVTVVQLQPQTLKLNVRTQGVVKARSEIDWVTEVGGKVVQMNRDLLVGAYFEAGSLLLTIDPRDYDYAITAAAAAVAEAHRLVLFEEAQAEQAESEWKALGEGKPTPLTLHGPQLAEARAKLKAAEADLAKAKLRRSRCELRAPFAGRVLQRNVGLGQYVQAGEKLARIYATDVAEIRLPVNADQLAYLDLPILPRGEPSAQSPRVVLSAEVNGNLQHWEGRLARTEGAVDEATGLLHVIAEVTQPHPPKDIRPPLLPGLFVQAEIEGRERAGLFVLPAAGLNALQEALLVDEQGRLHIHRVDVLRREADRVLVKGGLNAGDRLVVDGVPVPVEGMKVRLAAEDSKPREEKRAAGPYPESVVKQ
ncbi:efflux RND transporter periplasmic adaptor subunit [Methylococcus sp. EFPC2]|uniref:efflux RND transporter periplasmic adaptor subunit n=1 Tax=Methylococcus sp. EFPC2 TaxID=2812648 RepID=UPI00196832D5|nr:efflux RND transporter periplasmic adaptor subunit [Methylococcus sp. EFPC2]QSA98647.1 efflux RND transporter periplasmic adaptor subunit [Methylococcus sp. EFPC2]